MSLTDVAYHDVSDNWIHMSGSGPKLGSLETGKVSLTTKRAERNRVDTSGTAIDHNACLRVNILLVCLLSQS